MDVSLHDSELENAKRDAWSRPLDSYDMSNPEYYQNDTYFPYFDRLRAEAPVHYTRDSIYGPFWNVVRYKEGSKSVLVMIRGGADSIGDLALVAASANEVVYGRLRGHLPATLPEAIRAAVASDGTAGVKRQLLDAAGATEP